MNITQLIEQLQQLILEHTEASNWPVIVRGLGDVTSLSALNSTAVVLNVTEWTLPIHPTVRHL